jgi:hypothetical protein
MMRRLFTILTVVSLLLFVAVVVLWVRSNVIYESWVLTTLTTEERIDTVALWSAAGELTVASVTARAILVAGPRGLVRPPGTRPGRGTGAVTKDNVVVGERPAPRHDNTRLHDPTLNDTRLLRGLVRALILRSDQAQPCPCFGRCASSAPAGYVALAASAPPAATTSTRRRSGARSAGRRLALRLGFAEDRAMQLTFDEWVVQYHSTRPIAGWSIMEMRDRWTR